MNSGFNIVSWLVLSGYLAIIVGIGWYCSRHEHSANDFFLAGRRIPWWASGLSIFATMLSAITYLSIPARSYATNWTYFVLNCGILAIVPVVVRWYIPTFRQTDMTSAYEYLELRFHISLRLFGSLLFIVFQLGRMGIVVLLPALALSAVTGLNVYVSILIMGVLSTLYTVMGGIEAVIWTDVLQSVVLLFGAFAAIGIMLASFDHGWSTVIQVTSNIHKFQWVDWKSGLGSDGFVVILLAAFANNLISYTTDQAVIQRYFSTRDETQARRAVWINGLISVPASALFFLVGTMLFVFYQENPDRLPELSSADQIFAAFIAHEMPSLLSGLVIAGIFAAAMSSLDSSMHSVATAITTDFVERFHPRPDGQHLLRFARQLTFALGTAGTAAALVMARLNVESLWKLFLDWVGLLGGTLGGLFALGVLTTRVRTHHAWIGVAISGLALMWSKQSGQINGLLFGAIGMASCFGAAWLASIVEAMFAETRGRT